MKILLVNPPIHDFSAYDFWLKPYGLLTIAGYIQQSARFYLFDYLDRCAPDALSGKLRSDHWNRGEFQNSIIAKPAEFAKIPRYYKRFGRDRKLFQDAIEANGPFDFAFIQTGMTYWYPAVQEVIEDIRTHSPNTKIIAGGVYASICPDHARSIGIDEVIVGSNLEKLWQILGVTPNMTLPPLWQAYGQLQSGVLKITNGCPFNCTYCWVPKAYAGFSAKPHEHIKRELDLLVSRGAKDVAFYDDALLYDSARVLEPLLAYVEQQKYDVNFHTPNAMHARYITPHLAQTLVMGGFKTFYLGFESNAASWQKETGSKVQSHDLEEAVKNLIAAGACRNDICAYIIVGHPSMHQQQIEQSMRMVHDLGIEIMLSEFSPIPGTPDGNLCAELTGIDLSQPLMHNKTAWPIHCYGEQKINELKSLCHRLNASL